MIDWNQHRYTDDSPVRCVYAPRATYRGRLLTPAAAKIAGKEMLLQAMWRCEDGENYPGEFALEGADAATKDLLRSANLAWVASGDVAPAPTKEPTG